MKNKNLLNNLKYLKEINPELSNKVTNPKNPSWIKKIISNKDGSLNVLISTSYGIVPIDNPENPIKEDGVDRPKLTKNELSVLFGIGCGHNLKRIVDNREKDHKVIIVEKEPALLEVSFKNYDFSKEEKGSLIFVDNEDDIVEVLSVLNDNFVIEEFPILCSQYTSFFPSTYKDIIQTTMSLINNIMSGVGTVMAHGIDMAFNDINNLPYCLPYPGVKTLKDKIKGKPCLVISTGPSLSKNLHIVRKYQDKIFIIAVGQALRILIAHNIRPDLICSVDFGKVNMSHYTGLLDSDIPMVFINRTYAPLISSYRGPKIVSCTPHPGFDEETPATLLNDKGYIITGGSVAHFAFSLAVFMGSDKVILVGQDLALTDNRSHFNQADSSGKVTVENGIIYWEILDKSSPLYGSKNSMGVAQYTKGYFEDYVLTNTGLLSFLFTFENLVNKVYSDITVYNCTEGGADIKGTIKRSLYTVMEGLQEDCKPALDKSILELSSNEIYSAVKDSILVLQKGISNLEEIIPLCEKGLRENLRILGTKNLGKVKDLLRKNAEYSTKAHNLVKKDPLLTLSIYEENRIIHGKEYRANGKDLHKRLDTEDLQIRLKRNRLILSAVKERSRDLKELYEKTEKFLIEALNKTDWEEEIANNLKAPLLEEPSIPIEVFEDYLQKGNYAFILTHRDKVPLSLVKRALLIKEQVEQNMRKSYDPEETDKKILYNSLIEESRNKGRNKDFEGAERLLVKANDIFPEDPTALWGLATIYSINNLYLKSIDIYSSLIEKFPKNLSFVFEMGMTQINFNLDLGLKTLQGVIDKTDSYNHKLCSIAKLYESIDDKDSALLCLTKYLKSFPYDIESIEKIIDLYHKKEVDSALSKEEKDTLMKLEKRLKDLSPRN